LEDVDKRTMRHILNIGHTPHQWLAGVKPILGTKLFVNTAVTAQYVIQEDIVERHVSLININLH
jgi:hypothetical protein